MHPAAKLLVTLGYVVTVASFPATTLTPLVPLILYPAACIVVGGLPARLILRRVGFVLPVIVLLGVASPILDRSPALTVGGWTLTRGWVVFAAILVRGALAVSAAVCLTALSGLDGVCRALAWLRLPRGMVLHLRLMFRQMSTLSSDVGRALLAYRLRAGVGRGVVSRAWGGLAGGLLVRSLDRAERVHLAMLCRGGPDPLPRVSSRMGPGDCAYIGAWFAWFVLCRLVDLSAVVGLAARGMVR